MDLICPSVLDSVDIKRTKEIFNRLVHEGAAVLPPYQVACGTEEKSASLRRKSWGPELTV